MSEYTTEELIKSNRLCASGDCGSECYFYIYDEFCQDELKAHSAERLESQQKEIAELKDKIEKHNENDILKDARLREMSQRNKQMGDNLHEKNVHIAELEKQIAEMYTAEQFRNDYKRMCETYKQCVGCPNQNKPCSIIYIDVDVVKEWAASHPEKPKVTNGDKFREVFGHKNWVKCYAESIPNCPVDDCEECEYGINGEYKEPKNG